jgi:hypothetical protein
VPNVGHQDGRFSQMIRGASADSVLIIAGSIGGR